jgi:hypothetical protein
MLGAADRREPPLTARAPASTGRRFRTTRRLREDAGQGPRVEVDPHLPGRQRALGTAQPIGANFGHGDVGDDRNTRRTGGWDRRSGARR